MKSIKSLLFAAALLVPSIAFAQTATYWSPSSGYYGRDGGNDTTPNFPLVVGNHGIASLSNGFLLGATTAFTANWGTVINSDTQGTDTDFTVNLYTPSSGQGAVAAQSAAFVVNFGQGWASTTQNFADGGAVPMFSGYCWYAGPSGGTPGVTTFYGLPTSTTSMTFYNTTAFTPAASTNYHFACHVNNVGAAY
jgi:hypothetical protein